MSQPSIETAPLADSAKAPLRPLFVDLDGTLVKSDTLVDSLLMLVRKRPSLLFALPGQLVHGKAAFKAYVAEHLPLDVSHLPYNQKLLQFLTQQHASGREIYLATGADTALARRVADHLRLFFGVMGSDGVTNLTGSRKLDGVRNQIGAAEFDYVGNDSPDLPLLACAAESMVADPSLSLRIKLRQYGLHPSLTFEDRAPTVRSIAKAVRPQSWAANLIIFLPMILAYPFSQRGLTGTLLTFCCFCLAGTAACMVGDLLNIESDRSHPQKQSGPFAAGDLTPSTGVAMASVCLAAALWGASLLPPGGYAWLLAYAAAKLVLSMAPQRMALANALAVPCLFFIRFGAGVLASQTTMFHWLARLL